jgi:hypothetical protein
MPRTVFNPRTGRPRRQPPRFTPRKRRDPALYAEKRHIQNVLILEINESMSNIGIFAALASIYLFRHHQLIAHHGPSQGSYLILSVVSILFTCIIREHICLGIMFRLEEDIADIPVNEQELYQRPARFQRINDFMTDSEAKNLTNFNKDELGRLLHNFGLPAHLRVPAGHQGQFCYVFHREELLIYMTMKMW